MNALCTIIIWCGMHYATPQWMHKQIPESMWSHFEIFIYKYGQQSVVEHNPSTTALIGFSAGGLDVFRHYSKDYALVVLLDPTTRPEFERIDFGSNVVMIYNSSNWGGTNKSLTKVAERIRASDNDVQSVKLGHSEIPSYYFKNKMSNENNQFFIGR